MKIGLFLSSFILVVVISATGCSSSTAPVEEDLSKYNGEWVATSAIDKGKNMDSKNVQYVTVSMLAGKFHRVDTIPAKFVSHGDCGFSVDSKQSPTHFDLVHLDGDKLGKTEQGIVSLAGEELQICYALPGKPRPTDFVADNNNTLLVLKRK